MVGKASHGVAPESKITHGLPWSVLRSVTYYVHPLHVHGTGLLRRTTNLDFGYKLQEEESIGE
jgi:hypothetical protein